MRGLPELEAAVRQTVMVDDLEVDPDRVLKIVEILRKTLGTNCGVSR